MLYYTMYFYMLLLWLHSKHMHLVCWDDFSNRYIVSSLSLVLVKSSQTAILMPFSFFSFLYESCFLAYETKRAIIPLGLAALDFFFLPSLWTRCIPFSCRVKFSSVLVSRVVFAIIFNYVVLWNSKDSNIFSAAVLVQFISSKVLSMHKVFKILFFLF